MSNCVVLFAGPSHSDQPPLGDMSPRTSNVPPNFISVTGVMIRQVLPQCAQIVRNHLSPYYQHPVHMNILLHMLCVYLAITAFIIIVCSVECTYILTFFAVTQYLKHTSSFWDPSVMLDQAPPRSIDLRCAWGRALIGNTQFRISLSLHLCMPLNVQM